MRVLAGGGHASATGGVAGICTCAVTHTGFLERRLQWFPIDVRQPPN